MKLPLIINNIELHTERLLDLFRDEIGLVSLHSIDLIIFNSCQCIIHYNNYQSSIIIND